VHLATDLDVAASTVAARIRQMESDGAIRGHRPEIDPEKFGLHITAIFHMKATDVASLSGPMSTVRSLLVKAVDKSRTQADSVDSLSDGDSVTKTRFMSIYRVTGEYDLLTVWRFSDVNELAATIRQLQSQADWRELRTELALESTTVNEGLAEETINDDDTT